jgi:glycosyltransferase involved in cell wall biosynthesis
MFLSIIIPIYNEQESLPELLQRIAKTVALMGPDFEVLVIDDGSTDGGYEVLLSLMTTHPNLQVIRLRKNFGKSTALHIGFTKAQGEYIVTMDGDLQDRPEEIPNLLATLQQNKLDLVSGWKQYRQDPLSKTLPSKLFNKILRLISGIPLHDFNCGLKLYRNEVVKFLPVYGELHRFLPVLAARYGYKVGEVPVKHEPRQYGQSKFGTGRLFSGLLDVVTVTLLTKFSYRPSHFFGSLGMASFSTGFIFAAYLSIIWFLGERPIGNRPLLFLAVLLMIIGIQLISLGLLGEMIVSQKPSDFDKMIKSEHVTKQ